MDEVTSPDHLSSRHRWQVAWALAWPCFLFDLLLWLVTMGALRRYLDEELAESIYIICLFSCLGGDSMRTAFLFVISSL